MLSKLLLVTLVASVALADEPRTPVAATMTVQPATVSPGGTANLSIKVRIQPLFHIYALNKSGNENTPTTLDVTLPEGFKLKGDWKAPAPKKSGKARIYRDEVILNAAVNVTRKARSGKHPIKCAMQYQVCNEEVCWPPATLDLATEVEVVASK
jgi:DsbC/DsbD-like thiol-disulfide interchange protein